MCLNKTCLHALNANGESQFRDYRERESREVMELALMYDVAAKFMEKRHIHLFTALYVPQDRQAYYNSLGILRFIAGLALHCSDKHDFTANHNSEIGGITVCIIKSPISDKKKSQSRARFGGFFESSYYLGYGQLGKLYLKVLTIFGRGLS